MRDRHAGGAASKSKVPSWLQDLGRLGAHVDAHIGQDEDAILRHVDVRAVALDASGRPAVAARLQVPRNNEAIREKLETVGREHLEAQADAVTAVVEVLMVGERPVDEGDSARECATGGFLGPMKGHLKVDVERPGVRGDQPVFDDGAAVAGARLRQMKHVTEEPRAAEQVDLPACERLLVGSTTFEGVRGDEGEGGAEGAGAGEREAHL